MEIPSLSPSFFSSVGGGNSENGRSPELETNEFVRLFFLAPVCGIVSNARAAKKRGGDEKDSECIFGPPFRLIPSRFLLSFLRPSIS